MEPDRISIDAVRQRIDRGETIVFLDARNPKAWAAASTKLPGAVRVPVDGIEDHLGEIPRDLPVVTYCT